MSTPRFKVPPVQTECYETAILDGRTVEGVTSYNLIEGWFEYQPFDRSELTLREFGRFEMKIDLDSDFRVVGLTRFVDNADCYFTESGALVIEKEEDRVLFALMLEAKPAPTIQQLISPNFTSGARVSRSLVESIITAEDLTNSIRSIIPSYNREDEE